ncbi:glycosyltransferase family 4 protein [Massilia norwichensis]|uniref:Glycosyltransferase family 4 protein n=1 Tax=Massilia norwichensis TaxID=1442366 RepID=A0ABT2A5F7_9BURK|nr:glycosyltransferase family 4 protein [Massilia norwichensis]MCS0589414.1 glycosyltransferase family 4 protein [Massilia norwichensis]
MSKKKILLIHHGQGVGGGLIALLGLIRELRADHTVTVLCIFASEAVNYLRKEGVAVIVLDTWFYRKAYDLFVHSAASFFSPLGLVRNLYTLLIYFMSMYVFGPAALRKAAQDCDIVYLNSMFISDWAVAAKGLQKKVVVHIREPLADGVFGIRRALIRHVIGRNADLVIAISKDNGVRLGLPSKTVTVYDPIVLDETKGVSISVEPGLRYFTYVGGSQRIKGFAQLVDSLDHLDDRVRIFFLGYTHELERLSGWKFMIRQLLSPYTRRLPVLKRKLQESGKIIHIGVSDSVVAYYRRSVAVISPFSVPHASLPVLEAQHLGKPVIVSDVVGTEEFVDSSVGLVFENGDALALAKAINHLAGQDEETLRGMGEQGQKRSRAMHLNKPCVSQLLQTL